MATPSFAPGHVCKANFAPSAGSGGTAADINITGWDNGGERVDLAETTHTGSGGGEEYIATILRASPSITFNYDLANQHHLTGGSGPNINPGTTGVLKLYVSATKFYQYPVIIESVPAKVVVNGKVECTAQMKLNSASGTLVRPV